MKRNRIALIVVCALAATVVGTASQAQAAPRWAPASTATIHPGVQIRTWLGRTCTANFVFYDARYVYLGTSGYCSGTVQIAGASKPGVTVYNSRVAMDLFGEQSQGALRGNDFTLVRVASADRAKMNPSVPFWGGPTSSSGRSTTGEPVYSYGNSGSPSASTDRSPKQGIDTSAVDTDVPWGGFRPGKSNGGWTRYAHFAMPAPGDSPSEMGGADLGAPVLDARGRAVGILGPWAHDAADRVTVLSKALKYMKAHSNLDAVQLATGTDPFLPPH